jgi:hypothetical protein
LYETTLLPYKGRGGINKAFTLLEERFAEGLEK